MDTPTTSQCIALMDRVELPMHIREHSFRVAQVTLYLGRYLNRNSLHLNLEILRASALLHDIAKGICLESGGNHAELGAEMLAQWGYPQLAPIVAQHIVMDEGLVAAPITEAVVVNYADKRVKHCEIVGLESRFYDLVDRYAKTEAHEQALLAKLQLYRDLEQRLFAHVTIGPDDLKHSVSLELEPKDSPGGPAGVRTVTAIEPPLDPSINPTESNAGKGIQHDR